MTVSYCARPLHVPLLTCFCLFAFMYYIYYIFMIYFVHLNHKPADWRGCLHLLYLCDSAFILSTCAAFNSFNSVLLFLLLLLLLPSTGSPAGRWPAAAWCWSPWLPKRKGRPSWRSTARRCWLAPCWWRTSCWRWRSDVGSALAAPPLYSSSSSHLLRDSHAPSRL